MLTVLNNFLFHEPRNASWEGQLCDSPRDESEADQPLDPQFDLWALLKNECAFFLFPVVREFPNLYGHLKVIALTLSSASSHSTFEVPQTGMDQVFPSNPGSFS